MTVDGAHQDAATRTRTGGVDRLRRTVDILRFLGHNPPMTVSEVCVQLQLPLSSCHDLLRDMSEVDLTRMIDGKRYTLGAAAVALGSEIVGGVDVARTARPHLEALALKTQLDVYLAVPAGNRIHYASRCKGRMPVNLDIQLGQPLFLHSTAVGKLFCAFDPAFASLMLEMPRRALTPNTLVSADELTAELESIRESGTSVSRGESFEGITGIAAPVWNQGSRIIAAVHASSFASQLDDRLAAVTAMVVESAREITTDVGGRDDQDRQE